MDASFWNERYSRSDFVYGLAPNDFVKEQAPQIPPGPVLCLAEGEGRNAVYLAGLGHEVTAMDQSAVGMRKALDHAQKRGLSLRVEVSDLNHYVIQPGAWSGIVATFVHLPLPLRAQVHASVVRGLRPGGVFLLEAYTPAQLGRGTGGPQALPLLMKLSDLRQELAGLELSVARELEREVLEGSGHTGLGAVVQVLGRKA
jgi:SAM-dependent methyltransferase